MKPNITRDKYQQVLYEYMFPALLSALSRTDKYQQVLYEYIDKKACYISYIPR